MHRQIMVLGRAAERAGKVLEGREKLGAREREPTMRLHPPHALETPVPASVLLLVACLLRPRLQRIDQNRPILRREIPERFRVRRELFEAVEVKMGLRTCPWAVGGGGTLVVRLGDVGVTITHRGKLQTTERFPWDWGM